MAHKTSKTPTSFTNGDAQRVMRATKRLERGPFNSPLPRARGPIVSFGFLPAADSGAGCAAGSRSSPTSGQAFLQVPGTLPGQVNGTVEITYYNRWSQPIPPNATMDVYTWYGKYYVANFDCGATS